MAKNPGKHLTTDELNEIAEVLAKKEEEYYSRVDKDCKVWTVSHHHGPMYWLRNFTATENYHWREMGLLPVMAFRFKPFTDHRSQD